MLSRVRRVLDRGSYPLKVVLFASVVVSLVAAPSHPFSWLLAPALIGGAIEVAYPYLKLRLGLPDWTPNEAYITKLRHRSRASSKSSSPAAADQ